MDLDEVLRAELCAREQQDLYRLRYIVDSPQGVEIQVQGRRCLNFSSNDYLGLANHPSVRDAFCRGLEKYGAGSGASHLVCGHMRPHHELEEALAEFTGRDRALLFSTGYQANLGVIAALIGQGDLVLEDRLNHASLLDAGLLSRGRLRRYSHADVDSVASLLGTSNRRQLIVTDGVFSMDGDLAPLPELACLAAQKNAWLMVDDAHGFGVLGKRGGGTMEQFSLTQQAVPVLMATLGKALGVFGAFVAGNEALIETLIQKARTYIYTTALPPSVASAALQSLKLAREETWRREKLQVLVKRFRRGAQFLGLNLLPSETPIQAVILADNHRVVTASQKLWERGFWVVAIRPPTVPAGTARLRITLSASHSEKQVDQLLEALAEACEDGI